MDVNFELPKQRNLLIYSLIGSLLSTIFPIMVALDHLSDGNFLLKLIDVTVLFSLVTSLFYASIWINLKWYKISKIKLLLLNFLFFSILTFLSILIHLPIWKNTTHIPIIFYIRDEFVRNITIFIVSYLAAKFFIKNIENQQIKIAFNELKNENLSSQVRGLMQQINPHFFFNTLNTLSGLVQESPEKSELFIDKLSKVFRYVLKMQENDIVLLEEEMQFAHDYFYLLKMRFDEKLFFKSDIAQTDNFYIVPLCTQLLIENAIKHNRMNRQFPMEIQIFKEIDYLVVCNTLNSQKTDNSLGLGLKNLNKRCELLAKRPIQIEQINNLFCVKVPLIKI